MGIRFICPACDRRVNVKLHQAGLRGFCPKCGAPIDVPRESTVVSRRSGLAKGGSPAPAFAVGGAGEQTIATLLPPRGRLLSATARPPIDPLGEIATAQWYVVPQGGSEPFGPADGPTMRRWMQEGRVAARSSVWRSDWPGWRKAGGVWPSLLLQEPVESPAARVAEVRTPSFAQLPVPAMPATRDLLPVPTAAEPGTASRSAADSGDGSDRDGAELYYPRRSNGLYLAIILLMIVAAAALAVVTWRVVRKAVDVKASAHAGERSSSPLQPFVLKPI